MYYGEAMSKEGCWTLLSVAWGLLIYDVVHCIHKHIHVHACMYTRTCSFIHAATVL